jgi:rare lipoprotein A (peptidoglycan hydrolase)
MKPPSRPPVLRLIRLPLLALVLLLLGTPAGEARAATASASAHATSRPARAGATKAAAKRAVVARKKAVAAKKKVVAAEKRVLAKKKAAAAKKKALAKRRAEAKKAAREARLAREAEKGRSRGKASWYGPKFHGKQTASGERFDRKGLTAAHRDLPFGTRVRVTNTRNGQAIVVRINDRGPYSRGRIIDLSEGAARKIGMMRAGTARVLVEVLPGS